MKRSAPRFAVPLVVLVSVAALTAHAMEALPRSPRVPANNPSTPAKLALGQQLFFDPRISLTGTVSCNSCHNVMAAGEDGRPVSLGVAGRKGGRSAPTVWNAAYLSVQFWDGRARSLEAQARGPMTNPVEMGMADHASVIRRIDAIPGYRRSFREAFGGGNPVTIDHVAMAIAAYERTLVTPNSPFDRYLAGDKTALSASAERGMRLAESVGCTACHNGPVFAGPSLPDGDGYYMMFPIKTTAAYEARYHLSEDPGRYTLTRVAADRNTWRVQQWRNVALTAPYFHNGSVPTLDEAVRVMARTQLGRDLSPAQVADLVAFLGSLTGEFPRQSMPRLPEMPGRSAID